MNYSIYDLSKEAVQSLSNNEIQWWYEHYVMVRHFEEWYDLTEEQKNHYSFVCSEFIKRKMYDK